MTFRNREDAPQEGLTSLLKYVEKVVSHCDTEIARRKSEIREYENLRERLGEMPKKLSYEILVPFGTVGYMPGKLKNTNKVLMLLGDNIFAEVSCYYACKIIDRRISFIQKTIAEFESQKRLAESHSEFGSKLFSNEKEGIEIREPYDEKAEKEWKEKRRRKKKPDMGKKKGVSNNEFEALMKRLDELERQELEELDEDDENVEAECLTGKATSCSKEGNSNINSELDSDDLPSPPLSPTSETVNKLPSKKKRKSVRFNETPFCRLIHSGSTDTKKEVESFDDKSLEEVIEKPEAYSRNTLHSILRNNEERSPLNNDAVLFTGPEMARQPVQSSRKAFSGIVFERNFGVAETSEEKISESNGCSGPKRISQFKRIREKSVYE